MRREQGFTLIEILCALTILSLVLAVSLRILTGSTTNAAAMRDYSRALAVAQSHLALLQAADHVGPLERGGDEGEIHWSERIRPCADPAFSRAPILKSTAWRLDSMARLPDGRLVALTTVRLERLP